MTETSVEISLLQLKISYSF